MNCTCPKCQARVEVDLATEVTEAGSTALCPSCNARFHLHRESFAARATRKPGEISCAACGIELGPELHCTGCGTPFPNYIVAGTGRKRAAAPKASLNLNINIFPSRKTAINVPSLSMSQEQKSARRGAATAPKRFEAKRPLVIGIVAVLAVALGGGAFYVKKKSETAYTKNFALACYAIQVGADKSRKTSQRLATDWKNKLDAGQGFTPRSTAEEEREMAAIRSRLDEIKEKLAKEPDKFANCNQKLANLENAFNKLRGVSKAPGNSLPEFNNTLSQANAQYKQAANELKSGLQPELMEELKASSEKFRGLRPLLQEG